MTLSQEKETVVSQDASVVGEIVSLVKCELKELHVKAEEATIT